MIRLTSLLKMLLACTVTRGIWRFQPLIFDDTKQTACSAMTSPYRQGVNSYIVHFHSLFQAFRTLRELDIMYSVLKFFINISLYTANATYAPAAGAPVHLNSLSDLTERSSREELKSLEELGQLFDRNYWLRFLGTSRWPWCVAHAVGKVWLCLSFGWVL